MLHVEASAERFGLSYLYIPSGRCVRDRDPETCPQTNPNPQTSFISRSSKSMQHFTFSLYSPGCKPASVFLKEFTSCWEFVFQKCKKQFCLELLAGSNLIRGTAFSRVAAPGVTHLGTAISSPTSTSRVKMLEPGKNWATISTALCTTWVEHKSAQRSMHD